MVRPDNAIPGSFGIEGAEGRNISHLFLISVMTESNRHAVSFYAQLNLR